MSASVTVVKQPAESYAIIGIFVAEPAEPVASPPVPPSSVTVFAIIVVDTDPLSPLETNIESVTTSGSIKFLPSPVRVDGAFNLIVFELP